ncbi:MAG TPA: hypothetical protein DEV98_08480 [Clostridiales bacterium]|nr:hypothetical protein [Clostridiales bacterium]
MSPAFFPVFSRKILLRSSFFRICFSAVCVCLGKKGPKSGRRPEIGRRASENFVKSPCKAEKTVLY